MRHLKRAFDLTFSAMLGVLLIPVFAIISIALKTTSPGPVLFKQKRLGRNGTIFLMNKFRKFPSNWGSKGPGVTLQFDSRMTKVGRVLERTKLDELPQLWNIFKGEMSFVGPRPETVRFEHLFVGEFKRVLDYKPGIFGPNQAKYRNESAMYPENTDPEEFYSTVLFPDKAKRDLEYFEKATFIRDVWWILSGVFALIFSAVILRRSSKSSLYFSVVDVAAVLFGWMTAHYLKYGPNITRVQDQELYVFGFGVIPIVSVITFFASRVYRNPPRYFSETDFYRLTGSVCVAWIFSAIVLGFLLKSTSSLLLAVSCITSIVFMIVARLGYKSFRKKHESRKLKKSGSMDESSVKIVVCGITDQSVELCRLLTFGFPRANVLGLVDGDRDLVRREIYGFEILGNYSDLDMLHTRYNIDYVWIASDIDDTYRRRIMECCFRSDINVVDVGSQPSFKTLLSEPPAVDLPEITAKTAKGSENEVDVEAEGVVAL